MVIASSPIQSQCSSADSILQRYGVTGRRCRLTDAVPPDSSDPPWVKAGCSHPIGMQIWLVIFTHHKNDSFRPLIFPFPSSSPSPPSLLTELG